MDLLFSMTEKLVALQISVKVSLVELGSHQSSAVGAIAGSQRERERERDEGTDRQT